MAETNDNKSVDNAQNVEKMGENFGEKARITPGTTRVLKLIFNTSGGSTVTWNVKYPKTSITKAEVESEAEEIIDDGVILYKGYEATDLKDSYIYETTYSELA